MSRVEGNEARTRKAVEVLCVELGRKLAGAAANSTEQVSNRVVLKDGCEKTSDNYLYPQERLNY